MTREWANTYQVGVWVIAICVAIPFLLGYFQYLRKWWVKEQNRHPHREEER